MLSSKLLGYNVVFTNYSIKTYFIVSLNFTLFFWTKYAYAQVDQLSTSDLKKLSMEELLNIEVTSVSKRQEKLSEVASAIQVITQEDIRHSAATNLPEALRLSPNLQVAQLNSYSWIISARGFNGVFANKLLVMIDGRTVYSPLFAGVFWDAQSVLLEDVDRIEIISGPGATLWGANAVNGVINIITKKASDTNNLYASVSEGSFFKQHYSIRYGGKIGSGFSYRFYAQHTERGKTYLNDSTPNTDKWSYSQAGFRIDWDITNKDALAVQSNFYVGTERTTPGKSTLDGQNAMARWTHTFSEKSELILQTYYDRTWRRDIPSTISDQLGTYDLDLQHQVNIRKRHVVLWGAGYRLMQDKSQHSTAFVGFLPESRDMALYNAFIQDEISLLKKTIKFTIGTRFLHNVFTGLEVQPSTRLSWIPNTNQTIWAAISRAVRMPSRIDVDYNLPTYQVPQGVPHVAGGPNFVSEKVIAYELGYRLQPTSSMSLSLATFYNQYDDIYTVEALPSPDNTTYQIQNGAKGYSWGAELSLRYKVSDNILLRGGYTHFYKDLKNKPHHEFDPAQLANLGYDAKNLGLVQLIYKLPLGFEVNLITRYCGKLSNTIPEYFTYDTKFTWTYKQLEFSLVGQNLWKERHKEYLSQIQRSIYGKLSCRLF